MSSLALPIIALADERHLEALMSIMRASFDAQFGEAWSTLQLAGTISLANSFARQAINSHGVVTGFTLCRAAGPEVELLLIAVDPAERGKGVGRLLIENACRDAFLRGASEVFLEVRENNHAARALYRDAGFIDVGFRADYYAGTTGARFGAVTMRRGLDDLI